MTGAYTDLVNNAQNVASQPLQLYNGPLVAGLTDQQNQAVSGIGAAANSGAPGFAQAQQFINQSATPITPAAYSPEAIQQYMSPYTKNVVDATQNQFNLQNAQQQSGLRGNAASAGALGGDREAILQAQLAGQQTSAQAPVIAGLYNQGFNQAQGEFNTQQGVGLSAAQANNASAANAGYATGANTSAAQSSALAGNQAYLTAAGLQQGVNQANLNVPYEQYLQTQAYPYQNLDFLSSILGGASQGSGTTTTGTQTKPINWAGLLMQGAGAVAGAKNGGRIGLAAGGIPDVSTGYVPPPMQMQPGRAVSPQVQSQDSSPQETADGGLSIHDLLSGAKNVGDWLGGSGTSEAGKGMGALGLLGFGHGGRTRLADGGIDDPDGYIRDVLAGLQPSDQSPSPPHPTPSSDQSPSAVPAASQQGLAAAAPAGATMLSAADTPPDWRGQATNFAPPSDTPSGLAAANVPSSDNPTWDDGTPVTGGGSGLAAASAPAGQRTIWQAPEPDVWHSVLAGLGGFLSHGLGAGISTGLKDYDDQMDPHPVVDHSGSTIMVQYGGPGKRGQIIDTGIPTEAALNSRAMADWRRDNTDMNRDTRTAAITERADAAAAAVAQRAEAAHQASLDRENAIRVAGINASAGRYTPIPGKGVGADGKPVDGVYMTNGKTGEMEFRPGIVLTNKQGVFRSLPAMVAATWQQEHPNASAEDAENFAAAYTARIAGASNAGRGAAATAINEGTVNNSIGILRKLIPIAASTGPVTSLNDLFQSVGRHTNDANAINFKNAIDSITAEYARVLTGATSGAPSSDAARRSAEERILTGYNAKALPAVLDQMQAEMRGRSSSYANVLAQHTGGTYTGPSVPRGADEASSQAITPQRPASVPTGAAYSPSRKQWRDTHGKIYDSAGVPQ